MDHSIQAYLERQSTETLDQLLREYLQDDQYIHYGHVIPIILKILYQRDKDELVVTPEIQALWENYLENIKKK